MTSIPKGDSAPHLSYPGCGIAGVPPRFEEYTGDDPLGFVISKNLQRRHLSELQRAMVASNLANMRQVTHKRDAESNPQICGFTTPVTQAKAAELLNVSDRIVQHAKPVKPEAAENRSKKHDCVSKQREEHLRPPDR